MGLVRKFPGGRTGNPKEEGFALIHKKESLQNLGTRMETTWRLVYKWRIVYK